MTSLHLPTGALMTLEELEKQLQDKLAHVRQIQDDQNIDAKSVDTQVLLDSYSIQTELEICQLIPEIWALYDQKESIQQKLNELIEHSPESKKVLKNEKKRLNKELKLKLDDLDAVLKRSDDDEAEQGVWKRFRAYPKWFCLEPQRFSSWFSYQLEKQREYLDVWSNVFALIERSELAWKPASLDGDGLEAYQMACKSARRKFEESFRNISKDATAIDYFNDLLKKAYRSACIDVEIHHQVRKATEFLKEVHQLRHLLFSQLDKLPKIEELLPLIRREEKDRADLSDEQKRWLSELQVVCCQYQQAFNKIIESLEESGKLYKGGASRYIQMSAQARIQQASEMETYFAAYEKTINYMRNNLCEFDPGIARFSTWFDDKLKRKVSDENRRNAVKSGREVSTDPTSYLLNDYRDQEESESENAPDDIYILDYIDYFRAQISSMDHLRRRPRIQEFHVTAQELILSFLDILENSREYIYTKTVHVKSLEVLAERYELPIPRLTNFWHESCEPILRKIWPEPTPRHLIIRYSAEIRTWALANDDLLTIKLQGQQESCNAQTFILAFLQKLKNLGRYDYKWIRSELAKRFGVPKGESCMPQNSVDYFWHHECSPRIRQFLLDQGLS
ncbi:hypothetical protein D0962_37865 [Leptolyngbyaceae cyanobacterium CCMR0082]|uniref:Uncharacterized protein n=1 Tax=Adonisia turfae CCMR0082 TaxID=2304604 RepID=A0A6M0SIK2_9CYAN|nr:hypothetical protein [Adonisia turfae]NEZ68420.1 hypothetical protein [Adonisia turfae CCMR0082]